MKLRALILITMNLQSLHAAEIAPLPVNVSASHPDIRYSGRFDQRDPEMPSCSWPGCTVTVKFHGTALNAKFLEQGENFWQVEIDGKRSHKLALVRGEHWYGVAAGLAPGEHLVTLTKATEGFVGVSRFGGFQFDEGARVLSLPPVKRRIEVIGDSISCGYGTEAASPREGFTPGTENAWLAYGAVAARELARIISASLTLEGKCGRTIPFRNSTSGPSRMIRIHCGISPNGDPTWW